MTDTLLVLNLVLSSLVVATLLAGAFYRWERMPKRDQRVAPWIILTYVLVAYGAGEAAAMDGQLDGFRFALFTLNLIGLLIALLYHPRHERQTNA